MTVSRWIRIIGSGIAGLGAVSGLLVLTVIALTTPQYTGGCIMMPRPSIGGAVIIFFATALVAALLGLARTTTSALIGSLLLIGFACTINDNFLSPYAALLGAGLLVVGVVAKCVEEFPGFERQK